MEIQLSDHFTYKKLFRYVLPSILMMLVTSTYSIVDGLFVSNFVGKTAFAAVNLIMPLLVGVSSVGFMLGTGGSAIVSMTLGQGKGQLANRYFSMIVYATFVLGCGFAVLGFLLSPHIARPLVALFTGFDQKLMLMTLRGGRISLFSFIFAGINIWGSSFFTALNNGLVSALISFLRIMVFQVATILILPLFFGLTGIWCAMVAADMLAALVTMVFLITLRSRYGY